MAPLLWLGATALAGWAGWKWLGPKSVHRAANIAVGGQAGPGDEILVSTTKLEGASPTTNPIAVIRVQGGDAERVQGPFTGSMGNDGTIRYVTPVGSFVVQRKDIARITRNGVLIAEIRGASGSGAS